jgi:GDP-mannose 6-dehydrogenase
MNISIFGLGYVGTVMAACLSKYGHSIIGVDTDKSKIDLINKAISPVTEPGIDALLKESVEKEKLSVTSDAAEAVKKTDLSFICVGTPSHNDGSLNLEYVFNVTKQIGKALQTKKGYHAITVRSTVLPGTVERVASLIADLSDKELGKDFDVASNPEFMREGTSIFDFENPPFTVVGASSKRLEKILKKVYASVKAPFYSIKIKEAELLKYACNAFHAAKVVFANEIGAISKKLGIDSHAVIEIFLKDTKLNISPYYLKPGFAFGGSCLPKDVRAIAHKAKSNNISIPLLESLIPSNEAHVERILEWIIQKKKKNIGILGLSFKASTDDVRESPIIKVIKTLTKKKFSVSIFDKNVNLSRLTGANKAFLEQEIPDISNLMKKSIAEVLEKSEIIIIANKSKEFGDVLDKVKPNQIILDLVRMSNDWDKLKGNYEGICW